MKVNFKHIAVWLSRLFVSAILVYAGISKLLNSSLYPWMEVYPNLSLLSLAADTSVGIGLLVFPLLGFKKLTKISGFGVIIIMIGAITLHIIRCETNVIAINVFLLLLGVLLSCTQDINFQKEVS
ncbi:DoxX family protein [Sphingobacterium bambusae]|uniref:DoxX family protein n=1 Tax=Sphingobacterium bambusae TaxID=662858 RepID=A0ABW6BKF1_9SPHI|nr:DoxX family protein [Sphingobacterium bambusae]WPL49475.1 DoxX family protein [Sphingobacterium bambusae]